LLRGSASQRVSAPPVRPAQFDVRALPVHAQPHGQRVGVQLLLGGGVGGDEHADDVPAVGVGVHRLLPGEFGGEQQLRGRLRTGLQPPLVVGVQQAEPGDERRLTGAVGVGRALPGHGDQPPGRDRHRVGRQPGDVDHLDAGEHTRADKVLVG
jgi:hypothetical protein